MKTMKILMFMAMVLSGTAFAQESTSDFAQALKNNLPAFGRQIYRHEIASESLLKPSFQTSGQDIVVKAKKDH
ncbi:MAG: hypothetical protein HYS08_09300 [Chlamydiae bacterium]|nr:hypothetical protein [Chlamydiota bacterium]MBI3267334.1 hypothetical protein [Chlamydiota bacterium]